MQKKVVGSAVSFRTVLKVAVFLHLIGPTGATFMDDHEPPSIVPDDIGSDGEWLGKYDGSPLPPRHVVMPAAFEPEFARMPQLSHTVNTCDHDQSKCCNGKCINNILLLDGGKF